MHLVANTKSGLVFADIKRDPAFPAEAMRWIGKCKKCGARRKLEGQVSIAHAVGSTMTGWRAVLSTDGQAYVCNDLGTNPYVVTVPCGDHWCRLEMVHEGTKDSKHTCGARCTNATGPSCDCRCKGANHGTNAR